MTVVKLLIMFAPIVVTFYSSSPPRGWIHADELLRGSTISLIGVVFRGDGWAPLTISGMSTFRWNSVSATHWTWSLLGCSTVWCRGRIVDMRRRWPFGAILAVLAGFGEYQHSRVGGRGRGPTADGSWRSSETSSSAVGC